MDSKFKRVVTQEEKEEDIVVQLRALIKQEATRRIHEHWDEIGQINVSLGGIYSEADEEACKDHIKNCREKANLLIKREDLLFLLKEEGPKFYKQDKYWVEGL